MLLHKTWNQDPLTKPIMFDPMCPVMTFSQLNRFFCYMSRVTNLANGNTWLYTVNFKCNSTGVIDSEYWIDILNLAGDICLHWFGFNSPHFWMLRIPCLENSLWYVFGEKLCFNMVFGPLGYILQTYSHIVYIKLSALRGVIFVVKFSTDQTRA